MHYFTLLDSGEEKTCCTSDTKYWSGDTREGKIELVSRPWGLCLFLSFFLSSHLMVSHLSMSNGYLNPLPPHHPSPQPLFSSLIIFLHSQPAAGCKPFHQRKVYNFFPEARFSHPSYKQHRIHAAVHFAIILRVGGLVSWIIFFAW